MNKLTQDKLDKLREYAAQGLPTKAIAERLGVSPTTVNSMMRRNGIKRPGDTNDRELCQTCYYRGRTEDLPTCDYIIVENEKRGCPVGNDCVRYKRGDRPKNALQWHFMKEA